ncbi:hypothetical protein M8C21_007110 [Ambrosia artemisiifolia]|uniref:Myb-like domain-containing protein n=1 Tax=Ambrosia artemisiifolia TaxID=4212 RepID=A0AAD5CTT0_AMBAR|nr:hypothetical protein M8C21_007110 [Ambrosia artemisiifolia]
MDSKTNKSANKETNRGEAWTSDKDEKLAEAIKIRGPKKWTVVAAKAGGRRAVDIAGMKMKEEDGTAIDDDHGVEGSKGNFNVDEFFYFSNEDPLTLDWVNRYLAGTNCVFL